MDSQLGFLGFLSIFALVGGSLVGGALRGIVQVPKRTFQQLFLLLFGSVFACMPLFAISQELDKTSLIAGIVFVIVIVAVSFVFAPQIQQAMRTTSIVPTLMGGLFVVIGMGAMGVLLREREFLMALLFGGMFSGIGGLFFWLGLKDMIGKGKDDDQD